MLHYGSSNTTHLGDGYTPTGKITRISSLAANEYQVTNLTHEELPAAYRALLNGRKRSWSDDAFSVAGKDVAATGLAAVGIEHAILTTRLWYINDKPAYRQSEYWKRTQAAFMFDNLISYAFLEGLTARHEWCQGGKGGWRDQRVAVVVASGATHDPWDDYKAKIPLRRKSDEHRAFVKTWYSDPHIKHDPLRKRVSNRCGWRDAQGIPTYANDVANTPTGDTVKVTCKAYSGFGYCDQLAVAQTYISEMVRRGKTEATFTVYNRHTREAHMRCSIAARPYFFNKGECPFELPGDQDGKECTGCPKF